ncbi:MAG: hypothetical protein ABR953_14045 [Candidatus Acidiferrales bacterium]|jgi:hypothetical protein
MKTVLTRLKAVAGVLIQKTKVRKGLLSILAAFVVFQLYFVRELLAAELIFGVGFAVVLVLVGIFYLVGTLGERGLELTEAGARVALSSARRGYSALEEISKRPLRHPHSESAQ